MENLSLWNNSLPAPFSQQCFQLFLLLRHFQAFLAWTKEKDFMNISIERLPHRHKHLHHHHLELLVLMVKFLVSISLKNFFLYIQIKLLHLFLQHRLSNSEIYFFTITLAYGKDLLGCLM